jgi:hypothetical protein
MLVIRLQPKVYQLSSHCVGGISNKYAFNRLALPSLGPMQIGTNLIQMEVVTLEDTSFLLLRSQDVPLLIRLGMTYMHP